MITLILLLLAGGVAQAEVNFAGDWKLNVSKSDFGQFPAPSAMTQQNAHEEPSLKVAVKISTGNGDFDWESTYRTDGTETTNQFGPNQMKSRAAWEGGVLVINTKGSFGDTEATIVDRWTLSADGKTFTIQRGWKSSRGEMEQKLVLEKQ